MNIEKLIEQLNGYFVAKESERGLPMKFRSPETEEVFGNTHDEIIGGVE